MCVFSYAARGNIIFLLLCLFFLIIMPLLRHIACCVCIICVYTALVRSRRHVYINKWCVCRWYMYCMVSSCAPGGPKSLLIMKYVGHLSNQTHASYGETVTPGFCSTCHALVFFLSSWRSLLTVID